MAVTAPSRRADVPPAARGPLTDGPHPGRLTDQIFRWVALVSGLLVLVVLGLIAYSTTKEAWPWFKAEGFSVLANDWNPAKGHFGAGAMIYGTFLVGAIAL